MDNKTALKLLKEEEYHVNYLTKFVGSPAFRDRIPKDEDPKLYYGDCPLERDCDFKFTPGEKAIILKIFDIVDEIPETEWEKMEKSVKITKLYSSLPPAAVASPPLLFEREKEVGRICKAIGNLAIIREIFEERLSDFLEEIFIDAYVNDAGEIVGVVKCPDSQPLLVSSPGSEKAPEQPTVTEPINNESSDTSGTHKLPPKNSEIMDSTSGQDQLEDEFVQPDIEQVAEQVSEPHSDQSSEPESEQDSEQLSGEISEESSDESLEQNSKEKSEQKLDQIESRIESSFGLAENLTTQSGGNNFDESSFQEKLPSFKLGNDSGIGEMNESVTLADLLTDLNTQFELVALKPPSAAMITVVTALLLTWFDFVKSQPITDPRLLRIDLIIEQSSSQRNMRGSRPFSSLISPPVQSTNDLDFLAPGGSLTSGGKITEPSSFPLTSAIGNPGGGKKRSQTSGSNELNNESPKMG
ncbi:hypothetical protein QAD02_023671 [Eretmocerus hayati]|uniref:Uncharacterized protein n=1 Tax=Eretmocerus hayati TaxID=131215 RepID=A0ACC2PWG5_9HYME|nr:hypothetical protein QAD02_023671 [Eretmocerus hayati]